jgi:hypothetical protein
MEKRHPQMNEMRRIPLKMENVKSICNMNRFWIGLLLLISACDGKLTDEQRRKMREQMELHKIKRVTETEITEAAFAKGRSLINDIESMDNDSIRIDSMLGAHAGRIRWIVPGSDNVADLEQQLIEAYIADESGGLTDNIQRMRVHNLSTDSILYTKPVVTKLPDGSERFEGVWNIWLSQKQLILAMDKD